MVGTAATPRSTLFVPADAPRRFAKAAACGADAVMLDLEDSVSPSGKVAARRLLLDGVTAIGAAVDTGVRINAEPDLIAHDLDACAAADVAHILVPKVASADDLDRLLDLLGERAYRPRVSILVESCLGLTRLDQILGHGTPLETVALGVEDLRAELEIRAPGRLDDVGDSQSLLWAHATTVVTAIARGVRPVGLLGSIAEFTDLAVLESGASAAWRMGYQGSYCIHPAQVPVLNACFSPDEVDVAWASAVAEGAVAENGDGPGSFAVQGRMVDGPVVARARRILESSRRVR